MRLGLCCKFNSQAIKFRTTTAKHLSKFNQADKITLITELCHHNANSLKEAITYCSQNKIGSFRINSQILPVYTHPEQGYDTADNGAE